MTNGENTEAKTITMYPIHWATVEAYAKDMGYRGPSQALRRIVDEWLVLKSRQLPLPEPASAH